MKETVKITSFCGPAARPDAGRALSLLSLLNNGCRLHEAARSRAGANKAERVNMGRGGHQGALLLQEGGWLRPPGETGGAGWM